MDSNRLQKAALISALASKLLERGSWCGETHIQKTVYFLQEVFGLPTGYDFIFYKHGPFSFDLRDELTAMRADGLFELKARDPYGPSLIPTPRSKELLKQFSAALQRHEPYMNFVSEKFGAMGVADLEKLTTALYVTREAAKKSNVKKRATRIVELKPHISKDEARIAIENIDQILEGSGNLELTK